MIYKEHFERMRTMANLIISDLLDSFNCQSEKVKELLTSFLRAVSDGRVPSKEELHSLNTAVATLQENYDAVYEKATSLVLNEELPDKGVSVYKYIDAIETSMQNALKAKLGEAKAVLEQFIQVKSMIEQYSSALLPFQQEAKKLLDQISETSPVDANDLISETNGPKLFLQAMEENINSTEGIQVMQDISKYYPLQVQWGIASHAYFLEKIEENNNEIANQDTVSEPCEDKANNELISSSAIPNDSESFDIENEALSEEENNPEEDMSVNSNHKLDLQVTMHKAHKNAVAEVDKKEDEIDKLFKGDNGISFESDPSADFLLATNKVKTAEANASSFKKEIAKLAKISPEIKYILPSLTKFGALSYEQIYMYGVCIKGVREDEKSKELVEVAINNLAAKGLLASYKWQEEEDTMQVFCLSPYCCASMQKQTIIRMREFWYIPYGDRKLVGTSKVNRNIVRDAVKSNEAILKYLYQIKKTSEKSQYQKIIASISWKSDHYNIDVYFDDKWYNCYFLTALSNDSILTATNVLVVSDEKQAISNLNCERVFRYCDNQIYLDAFANQSIEEEKNRLAVAKTESISIQDNEDSKKIDEKISNKTSQEQQKENEDLKEAEVVKQPQEEKLLHAEDVIDQKSALSPRNLLDLGRTPTDSEFFEVINHILSKDVLTMDQLNSAIIRALLLSYSAAAIPEYPLCDKISKKLQLATNILFGNIKYTSEDLTSTFEDVENENQCLLYAAYAFAMLTPEIPYDYGLNNQIDHLFDQYDHIFKELSSFKTLFNKLKTIRSVAPNGFTPSIMALLGDDEESEKFIADLKSEAKANMVVSIPKTRMKALPIMYNAVFGPNSDFNSCMEIIVENRKEDIEYVKTVLLEYGDSQNNIFSISEKKIKEKLDKEWDEANSNRYANFKLEYDALQQTLRQYRNRLNLMKLWVEHIENSENKTINLSRLKNLKSELLKIIEKIQSDLTWAKVPYSIILSWMLYRMHYYLNGETDNLKTFSELLNTGIISMTSDGMPIIDLSLENIKYYEPWRNVLRHICAKERSLTAVKAEILNDNLEDEPELMDNLHQLEMIGKLLGSSSDEYLISDSQLKEAIASAEGKTEKFKEYLELAYTYNQINETQKETLARIMQEFKDKFFAIQDFACWRKFLDALKKQIDEYAAARKKELRGSLDIRLSKKPDAPLLKAADKLLEEDMNFAVAEEYINRFDNGETELETGSNMALMDFDYFNDFIDPKIFNPLLNECRKFTGATSQSLKTFGANYIRKHAPKDWTNRQKEDSISFISNWPSRKGATTIAQMKSFFESLDFKVTKVTAATASATGLSSNSRKEEIFHLTVKPTPKSMADYRHPIAAFGTKMKSPLNVVVLFGNYVGQQLVDTVSALDLRGMSIVLIDRPLDLNQRRLIGEIFHTKTSRQNPFLLVDQVLALYLALHQVTERLRAMLRCTLPFTTYQPFVRDAGSTADEMFCGRTQELATIIDPNGASVVYGGRQLGKTALLERAESRCSMPENKEFAVYTNIIHCKSEHEFITTMVADIQEKTNGVLSFENCDAISDFCKAIDNGFKMDKISSFLLLIDEADNFLASISKEDYTPLQPLINLKRKTKNTFKFVLAGLHNVCRAQNATAENGVFGQLGTPLCIKPLSPTDALQLLSRPLKYLGFQIDRYPHLETILTNTNYYPGILQFFGYMLVETLTGNYAKYYSAKNGNPPFTLQDEQLGAVMNSSDLNTSIKEKFRWSLELDPRYFMIARCITMLYHYNEGGGNIANWLGYPVQDIIEMAQEYHIHCLEKESKSSFIVLLDEMVEMGILSKPEEGMYRLRRSSFVDIIGEDPDLLEKDIINNNKVISNA